jgi:hypothetical protein
MRAALFFALLPALAFAQSATPHSEDLGTVTGHITCSDTQRPARLAEVRLVSVSAPTIHTTGYGIPSIGSGVGGLATYTDLTGGYTIAGVEPGQYYLRVELTGYATPISQFTLEDLKSPSSEVQQRIQRELQLVTVAPHATVQADATIHHAGSISGTVTFDDGSPAIALGIGLYRRDENGKLQSVREGNITFTNGRGQFSVESLLPGEYVIEAKLITFEKGEGSVLTNGTVKTIPMDSGTAALPIYSGSVFRQKEASIVKVDAGQETADANISIPLGRLHEISGSILAKDSHSINSGQVELLDPDTREQVASAWAGNEGAFHLLHVPEGSYILKVTDARDMGQMEVHYTPDHKTATTNIPTLRTYGNLEQPFTVQTDVQSLLLTVPDKPSTTSAANSTGTN